MGRAELTPGASPQEPLARCKGRCVCVREKIFCDLLYSGMWKHRMGKGSRRVNSSSGIQ